MRRMRSVVLSFVLTFGGAAASHAQADGLRIRATRRDSIIARSTVTAIFVVSSQRDDGAQVMPHVEIPTDWSILTGGSPFLVGPHSTEMLMLSVVVPARAPAGAYPIRMWVTTAQNPQGVMDSVVVIVPPRRALDVGLIDRPGYVVSGKSYDAGFLVRNRGNMASVVRLAARSSLGSATMVDTLLRLEAEESRVVHARVQTPAGLQAATDDVLELAATQTEDPAQPTEASVRVTVIPEPSRKIEEYLKLPTQVHLRGASSNGVSPFEIFGRGSVRDGGRIETDFLFRGPTGEFSAFGERDEYRVELRAPHWRVRGGDQLFMLSSLTGYAQPGFGLGADATRGAITFGGFGQQFRRAPEKGSETGAFVSARPFADTRVALNFVDRAGGFLSGRMGSATAALARESYSADFELARSQNESGWGLARSARLSGGTSIVSYDIGHQYADTTFSGSQRGSEHDYFTASTHYWEPVSFALNGSTHRTDLSRSTDVPYIERLDVGTVSATLLDRFTLELGSVARGTTIQGIAQRGRQHGLRARGDQDVRFGVVSLEVEAGRSQEPGALWGKYTDVSVGGRRSFAHGGLGFWADTYSGGSVTKGTDGTLTLGADASMRIARTTDVTITGYSTRLRVLGAEWHSQVDAQVAHVLLNGTSITLRARMIGGGSLPSADGNIAYLEYGIPLRLPISRLRTTGRVYGTVIDAVTGLGVPGALVRLGPQVAITDKQGQVAFGGVPGGEHRVSMSQETSFADAVFIGDPTLLVDSARTQPTTFRLAIARSARVDISVRRFATVRTSVADGPDSLADAGPLANATLVLAGTRDTLYRTTTDNGKVSFTDVPPGTWVVSIRGETAAFHRFDPDRLEVTLAPGEIKELGFRLVPRKREVQLIGVGQELRPTTADPKATTPAAGTRTVKPNDKQQQQQQQQ
jgi:hypothetical protein